MSLLVMNIVLINKTCQWNYEETHENQYSGEIKLTLGPGLHRDVATAAAASGLSLNSWMKKVLEQQVNQGPNPLDSLVVRCSL